MSPSIKILKYKFLQPILFFNSKKGLWHSKRYIDKAQKTQFASSVNSLQLYRDFIEIKIL